MPYIYTKAGIKAGIKAGSKASQDHKAGLKAGNKVSCYQGLKAHRMLYICTIYVLVFNKDLQAAWWQGIPVVMAE